MRISRFESDLDKARNDISGFSNQISNLTQLNTQFGVKKGEMKSKIEQLRE
jgi:peptidoglycan hydrolase CwlO-like protein